MKVISMTPAGRKRNLEILVPYLLREKYKQTIDKHIFWLNTTNAEDIEYVRSLTKDPFFEIREAPLDKASGWCLDYDVKNIYKFFVECVDKDTCYIRLDDDICWIHEDAIKNLIDTRLGAADNIFLVYGNTVNNAICSYWHQQVSALPITEGIVSYSCLDRLGWSSGTFAEFVHRNFLSKVQEAKSFYFNDCMLLNRERVSINVISWMGSTFAKFGGEVDPDDEQWLATDKPLEMGFYNMIAGNALFSHFAYFIQRKHLENNTDLLSAYLNLSKNI
jgi:hypothetical protein